QPRNVMATPRPFTAIANRLAQRQKALMKIHWIGLNTTGRLGVSRKPDGGEALDEQMAGLSHGMVDQVISMLEPDEAHTLGLADEGGAAERHGVGFFNFPIPDHGVPTDVAAYRKTAQA